MESALLAPALDQLVRGAFAWLPGLGLLASRPLGIMLILPVFARAELGGLLRASLALALALPLLGSSSPDLLEASDRTIPLALLALKELFVGLLLGFLLGVPFWSIQAVGELIDTQRGITSEVAPLDPATRSQASAMGVFLGLAAIAVFVSAGGLAVLAGTLYQSYAIWPLQSVLPKISLESAMAVARTLDHVLAYTLVVAGPVVILLLLVDLCVMLIGRFAPQLNAYDLAPLVKNIAFMIFVVLYLRYLADYMGAELARTREIGAQLERLIQ
jgi:type III secretion protein T